MSNVTPITSAEQFDTVVSNASTPVIVDFYATWCGPCQAMLPVVDNAANELGENAVIVKLNIEEVPEITERFGVMSIPTFISLKDGQEADRKTGAMPIEDLVSMAK